MIDPTQTLMNARKDLERRLINAGYEITGGGISEKSFDIWYSDEGFEFHMNVKPIFSQDNEAEQ